MNTSLAHLASTTLYESKQGSPTQSFPVGGQGRLYTCLQVGSTETLEWYMPATETGDGLFTCQLIFMGFGGVLIGGLRAISRGCIHVLPLPLGYWYQVLWRSCVELFKVLCWKRTTSRTKYVVCYPLLKELVPCKWTQWHKLICYACNNVTSFHTYLCLQLSLQEVSTQYI